MPPRGPRGASRIQGRHNHPPPRPAPHLGPVRRHRRLLRWVVRRHLRPSRGRRSRLQPHPIRRRARLRNRDPHRHPLPALGNLTGLRILSLAGLAKLTGPLPPSLGRLSLLTELRLSGNSLTGPIPPSFSGLRRLEFLLLNGNRLSGAIPPSVFASSSLKFLALDENQFAGAIPPSIGKLSALERLDLQSNGLTGKIPMEIGNLRNLADLDLSKNRISGGIPESVGNLSKLAALDLSENRLTGAIPHSFTKMVSSNSAGSRATAYLEASRRRSAISGACNGGIYWATSSPERYRSRLEPLLTRHPLLQQQPVHRKNPLRHRQFSPITNSGPLAEQPNRPNPR
uniref:Uncharacterized protein n=1 Tax=Ananas comosus var. bracteatus TaxID=296719 RepID=A0A6V7PI00_ANACO|nr:unnamed protein product [Ananas comosus var. bracteatus]